MNKKMKILSFGEIIWDVYPDRKALGGAPLNFALHSAACGAEVYMISAVGCDPLGDEAVAETEKRGVSTRFILRSDRETGRCNVTLDENKVPSYDLMRDTAYDFISLSDADLDAIKSESFDAVCFGTLIQRGATSRATLRRLMEKVGFGTVFCDVNLRKGNYDESSVRFCLESATALKVSLEEAPDLGELNIYPPPADGSPVALADTLFSTFTNLRSIVLTDGANGAYSMERGGELIFCPARKVKVISTVGAGDSFGAAWLTSRSAGDTPDLSLRKAVDYSADVISGKR